MFPLVRRALRRKVRTSLTVVGVAIGVLALTVLGAMAERLSSLITSSMSMWAQSITVLPGREGPLTDLILPSHIDTIRSVQGVADVRRRIEFPYVGAASGLPGFMPQVSGVQPESLASLPLQEGRTLHEGDRGVAVAGADLAFRQGWRIGDEIEVHGRYFRLVGIAEPLLTVADQWIYLPLDDAARSLVEASPLLRMLVAQGQTLVDPDASSVEAMQVATGLQVEWGDEIDPEQLTATIQQTLPELTVLSPQTLEGLLRDRLQLVHAMVLGSALVGLIVGSISVVNTMVMAVFERRTEIALKRALGATTSAIVREILSESALIAVAGGLTGVAGGTLLTLVLNETGATGYYDLFTVTPRLVLAAIAFSVILGALAGLGPALYAARLSPVEGLRQE